MKNLILILLSFLSCSIAYAQGGPPMVTDDPGTPGDKHWEINIASMLSTSSNQQLIQFPYFDINYGVGEHLQLKVETGWALSKDNIAVSRTGAETILAGVKYRFLDEDEFGIAVSMYPQFQFHHFFSSKDPEIASPGDQTILPIEFSKTVGNWEFNPEIGYLYGTVVANEIFYGMVMALENLKPFEPLVEFHVNTHLDGSGSILLLNSGGRYTVNPHLNLLASVGHTVIHVVDSSTELDAYLGLQLEL